jgi:hypothetical protein
MTAPSGHPSFLALDRLALTHAADAATREHTDTCAICSEYVGSIRNGADVPGEVLRPRASVQRIWRRLAAAAIVAGAGAALFVGLKLATTPPSEQYSTVKGQPAVALYVKRGEQVFLWSSERHVMPGDRLRLQVAPDGFSYVTVLAKPSGHAGERLEPLYAGAIDPRAPTLLGVAWRVDDAPGNEALVVVLSRAALDERALSRALREEPTADDMWVQHLELPKSKEPEPP